jgi:hypothetical protein
MSDIELLEKILNINVNILIRNLLIIFYITKGKMMKNQIDKRVTDDLNKVGLSAPFLSFFSMQVIRLINMIITFILWCLVVYIILRRCILYINFWALTFTLTALGFLFVSSGRKVVEKKL